MDSDENSSTSVTTMEWDEEDTYLVVGIDFGTTFSGVAWALSTKPDDVDIITEWESEMDHNEGSSKVPSSISYSANGTVASWGFQEHDINNRQLSWFKLLLCDGAKSRASLQRSFMDELDKDLQALGKSPVQVISDYLSQLWSHATSIFKSRFGHVFFEELPIKLVLTIPAMWDHSAQELTKMAAEMAGITTREKLKVELVSEPEAAARFVLGNHLSLKAGEAFIVCDAGGGTIDLVSYQVEQTTPLRLKMCTEATGDLFGAKYLDDAFESTVRNKIGENAFTALSLRSKRKFLNDWEHGIKKSFRHGQRADKNWVVDLPGYPGKPGPDFDSSPGVPKSSTPNKTGSGGKRKRELDNTTQLNVGTHRASNVGEPGMINLKTTELELTFAEVCPRIIGLVQQQISALKAVSSLNAKAILLVGGFGSNKYLKEELGKSFPGIEIQQPRDAWSAICRGAVLKGISDDMVINHIAKYHYGVKFRAKYDQNRHELRDKVWCDDDETWKAANQMQWYIQRGENIAKEQQKKYNWCLMIMDRKELLNVQDRIFYSSATVAPKRYSSDVSEMCVLTAQFNPDLFDSLPEVTNSLGNKHRKLNYDIEMKVSSSGIDWLLHHAGKEMGRATLAIDYKTNHPGTKLGN